MTAAAAAAAGPPPSRRRRFRRLLLLLAVVVAALAAAVTILPEQIARFLLVRYVGDLGVVLEGEQTLDIDVMQGRVAFGPARFRLGDADPGQVTRMALRFSLPDLFRRRALVTTLVVDGLDLALGRDGNGEPLLNGVPLQRLLAPPAAGDTAAAGPVAARNPWGAGIDSFELTGSSVRFALPAGGEARLAIDRLTLEGFRSWEPDDPGSFGFAGALAGMPLTADGEAWPFADSFHVRLRYRLAEIDAAKLKPLVGDQGLAPAEGRVDLGGAGEITHDPRGTISLSLAGDLALAGLDVGRPDGVRLTIGRGALRHALRAEIGDDDRLRIAGTVGGSLGDGGGRIGRERTFAFAEATLAETVFALDRGGDGGLTLQAEPQLGVAGFRLDGDPAITAATVAAAVAPLSLTAAADGRLTIAAAGRLDGTGMRVAALPRQGVVGYAVSAGSAVASVAEFSLQAADDGLGLAGRATLTTPSVTLVLDEREDGGAALRATLETGAVTAERVGIEATGSQTVITAKGDVTAATGRLLQAAPADGRAPPPIETVLQQPLLTLAAGTVTAKAASTRVALSGTVAADRLATRQAAAAAPRAVGRGRGRATAPATATAATAALAIDVAAPRIEVATVDLVAGPPGTDTSLTARLTTQAWTATIAGTPAAGTAPAAAATAAKATAATASLDRLRWTREATAERLAGSASLDISGAEATWGAALPTADGRPTRSQGSAERLRLDGQALRLELAQDGRTALAGDLSLATRAFLLRSPALQAMAGGVVSVGEGRAVLKELARSRRRATGWRALVDGELAAVAAGTAGEVPHVTARRMQVTGFRINDIGAINLGDIVVEGGTASIDSDWVQRLGGDPAARVVAETVETVAETTPVRLMRLRTEDGLGFDFTDRTVAPPTTFRLQIETLDVGRLDTRKPDERTDVLLRATLNAFTPLTLQGWIAPLGAKPDFAIAARIAELQLPLLSPYAARAVGLNIDSGRLRGSAEATATAGQLAGVINLDILNLTVAAAGADGAARVEKAIGVPPATAIGLIEDDDGRIRLSLPVSGDLTSPSFDFSDAIGQAAGNVLKGAVLAPFRIALLPFALVASAAQAGPPKLPAVPFRAGSADIAVAGADIVDGLARVLTAEKKLRVQICGRATAADAGALPAERRDAAALRDLAEARTLAVRRALIDDRGVRRVQVLDCRILYDAADPGPPEVAVQF